MGSKQVRSDDKGRVRVRFMEVEIEGVDETLREGLLRITSAIPRERIVVKQLPAGAPELDVSSPVLDADHLDSSEDAGDQTSAAENAQPETAAKRPRSQRPAPKPPQIVEDLKPDEGDVPFADFCAKTKLEKESTITDRALVAIAWLKEHRPQHEMGGPEFYTLCRFMDWDVPVDPTEAMRRLKKDRFLTSAKPGKFALSSLGEKRFREYRK